jgi:hypothetical protein
MAWRNVLATLVFLTRISLLFSTSSPFYAVQKASRKVSHPHHRTILSSAALLLRYLHVQEAIDRTMVLRGGLRENLTHVVPSQSYPLVNDGVEAACPGDIVMIK